MPNYPDSDRALERALADAQPGAETSFTQTLSLERDWLAAPDTLTLRAAYHVSSDDTGLRMTALVDGHRLPLDEPVRLAPAIVPKPWGRELWLTGIEARGESGILTDAGVLPISSYLALAPRHLIRRAPLVLLKLLDPKPEPVVGDLYFEAHERKQEVYVVTHVDSAVWPDGRGGIRYGMNQALRQRYGDDDAFRRDYLVAVKRYEAVRRAIDAGDKITNGSETGLRSAMEAFTNLRPLSIGDVVVVPAWLPHALQHGVRVIEFQTPTYERHIISFAQKVVTQSHWDSETAVARMRLDVPEPPRFRRVADGVEQVVTFDDFSVWRVELPAGASLDLPGHVSYLLCAVVRGPLTLGPLELNSEEAALVPRLALEGPRRARHARLVNAGGEPAVALLAAPDL